MIMKGNGKQFSDVAREMESVFDSWLVYSRLTGQQFKAAICSGTNCKIEECHDGQGNRFVSILIDGKQIGEPFLWQHDGGVALDDFYVNTMLLLLLASSKYENKSFENAVKLFIDEKKKGENNEC